MLRRFWRHLVTRQTQDTVVKVQSSEISKRLARIEEKIDLLEYFSHGSRATYLGNNRVLVKAVVARANIAYLVEADDRLLSPWFIVTGQYETALTNFFVRNLARGSHCIDVGTNFGYFVGLMARFCPDGKIVGIEPDQKVFELARDSIFINGFQGHASVLNAAASDSDGELTLYRRQTRSANTSIAHIPDAAVIAMGEAASVPFTVKSVTLDSQLGHFNNRVDFLKIDVEGAEPLVFSGAQQLIKANPRLRIVMEWSPHQITAAGLSVSDFLNRLQALDLKLQNIAEDGSLVPLSYPELGQLQYATGIHLSRS